MHCAFADPKLLCGGTDGGPVLYDVKSQALSPVLHISLQKTLTPRLVVLPIYAVEGRGMCFPRL